MQTVAEIEARLVTIRTAIDKVMLGQEYTIDTGMTKQTVKKADLPALQQMEDSLESKLSVAKLKEGNCQITRGQSC